VEAQFKNLKIPAKYHARLIYRYLTPRARALCSRLDSDKRDDYRDVKDAVMKEYGLTAKTFWAKFNNLNRILTLFSILFILFRPSFIVKRCHPVFYEALEETLRL